MSEVVHERPGVYSSYVISSAVQGRAGRKTVGLVAVNTTYDALKAVTVTSISQAIQCFGYGIMADMIGMVLAHGAAAVVAVAVADADDYEDGFAILEQTEDCAIVLCDSTVIAVQQSLRDCVEVSSKNRNERICVVTGAEDETVSQLISRAEDLNSERAVLVAPCDVMLAAAVAGAIAEQRDPALPLGGVVLSYADDFSTRYSENDIDLLVRGGVTPLECRSGEVSVIRGVTTRTKTGDVADTTWRELSTVLIVDDVIPAIRKSLNAKFKRAKNTVQSRGAIRAQVVLELENKLRAEIISSYDGVLVEADAEDSTICVVKFAFRVANALNQIWISAYITV